MRTRQISNALRRSAIPVLLVLLVVRSDCFFSPPRSRHRRHHRSPTHSSSYPPPSSVDGNDQPAPAAAAMIMTMMMAARSPLRFLGPYPAMPLRFPDLATPSQRGRGASGVCLDWVLDTAANVNTINAAVARELDLERVGAAPGGVGAGGGAGGGGHVPPGRLRARRGGFDGGTTGRRR